jgi:hypothetical protein
MMIRNWGRRNFVLIFTEFNIIKVLLVMKLRYFSMTKTSSIRAMKGALIHEGPKKAHIPEAKVKTV